jgi:hypothetical protein
MKSRQCSGQANYLVVCVLTALPKPDPNSAKPGQAWPGNGKGNQRKKVGVSLDSLRGFERF